MASIPGSSSVYHQFQTLSAYAFVIPNVSTNAKANVIIGNPPYQMSDGGGTGDSAKPIYHLFIQQNYI